MKKNLYLAWRILLIGLTVVVGLYISGTLMNVYLGLMARDLQLSRSLLSLNGTLRYLIAFGLNLSMDSLVSKLGLKRLILIGLASSGGMLLLFSLSHSLWICYLAGAIGGLGSCLAGLVPMALLVRDWFPQNQGTVLAITSSMTGVAGVLMTPLASAFIGKHGWRPGFQGLALIIGGIFLLEALFLENPTEGRGEKTGPRTEKADLRGEKAVPRTEKADLRGEKAGPRTDNKAGEKRSLECRAAERADLASPPAKQGLPGGEKSREPGRGVVWSLVLISALFSLGALCVYSNTAVLLQDIGFPQLFATGTAVSLVSLFNIVGKFVFGRLCDRSNHMGKILVFWYSLCILAALYFVFYRGSDIRLALPGIFLSGIIGGIYSLPLPLMAGKFFRDSQAYTRMVGRCTAAANLSTAFASFIFHGFYDITNNYVCSLIYAAGLSGVCTVLVARLLRKGGQEKEQRRTRRQGEDGIKKSENHQWPGMRASQRGPHSDSIQGNPLR